MTTVLITGAAGHVGRRVTRRLRADGITVRAVVRRPVGDWPDGVEEVIADLALDPDQARRAANGVDAVIHLAGASEAALRENPTTARAASVAAAHEVASWDSAPVVYLSTVHVYGRHLLPGARITESTPTAPTSDYAGARLACEEVFGHGPAPATIFRLTNGLGAPIETEQAGWHVVSNELCRAGTTEGRLVLRSSGEQWRDFVPLVDVEAALSALVGRPDPPPGTFNFASGTSITVRALAEEIAQTFERLTGTRPVLEMPPVTGQVSEAYTVDVSRLGALELFRPTPRPEALEGVVADCLARQDALRGIITR